MSRQSYVCLLEYLCCDIDNCVATLFLCNFFKFVSQLNLYVATTFLLVLVGTMFIVLSAFLSRLGNFFRDRVLYPLNLISCYNFILMLRHSLLVLQMFLVATKFLCHDKTFCIQLIFVFKIHVMT